jgi:hypothetical protein
MILSYEFQVFEREYFGKEQVHGFRTFEPFWEVVPQAEESKNGHCKHCLPPSRDQRLEET